MVGLGERELGIGVVVVGNESIRVFLVGEHCRYYNIVLTVKNI